MDLNHHFRIAVLLLILATFNRHITANRHRLRHERGRNKRQIEHYIIIDAKPDEPESGNWGPWSPPSPCSRTCGGGIANQTRVCHDMGPDGMAACTGGSKKYFSCNIQNCEDSYVDFRAEQCSEYNKVAFEGLYYEWIPYTRAPNVCELNCMPRGERFYYRHKNKVIDGTPCDEENSASSVCVQGKCLPVGCDKYLGSPAREDKCRVCRGDGSGCITSHNVLDTNNLEMGYNDLLLIPAGATNILIKEVRSSNNYLALRNTSGHYYLNGDWTIDYPRTLPIANTFFHYERKPHTFFSPEKITAAGPIKEALYVVLLYQERNPGIEYEYSIPNGTVQQTSPTGHVWNYDAFIPCSVSCGGGFKTRKIWCSLPNDPTVVPNELCDPALEPLSNQTCNLEPCPPAWHIGNWSDCSKVCGIGGEQTREVYCKQLVSSGHESKIEDLQCERLIGPKPETTQSCNDTLPCPQWHIGPWKPCDHLCGEGKQTRTVRCFRRVNGRINVLNDSTCPLEKPPTEKPCTLHPCEGVDWITSDWTDCTASCGLTIKTRTVFCASSKGALHAESECSASKRPANESKCENSVPCEYRWFTSDWSKCSAQCGTGVQTRHVFCGLLENTSVKIGEDAKCDLTKKPSVSLNCTGPEECKGSWFAGPWSMCSKKCGGGLKSRKVLCFVGNTSIPTVNCDENKILFASEDCNNVPCNADEVTPVDPKKLIEDESEDYECEGDDCEVEGDPEALIDVSPTSFIVSSTEFEGSGDGTEPPTTVFTTTESESTTLSTNTNTAEVTDSTETQTSSLTTFIDTTTISTSDQPVDLKNFSSSDMMFDSMASDDANINITSSLSETVGSSVSPASPSEGVTTFAFTVSTSEDTSLDLDAVNLTESSEITLSSFASSNIFETTSEIPSSSPSSDGPSSSLSSDGLSSSSSSDEPSSSPPSVELSSSPSSDGLSSSPSSDASSLSSNIASTPPSSDIPSISSSSDIPTTSSSSLSTNTTSPIPTTSLSSDIPTTSLPPETSTSPLSSVSSPSPSIDISSPSSLSDISSPSSLSDIPSSSLSPDTLGSSPFSESSSSSQFSEILNSTLSSETSSITQITELSSSTQSSNLPGSSLSSESYTSSLSSESSSTIALDTSSTAASTATDSSTLTSEDTTFSELTSESTTSTESGSTFETSTESGSTLTDFTSSLMSSLSTLFTSTPTTFETTGTNPSSSESTLTTIYSSTLGGTDKVTSATEISVSSSVLSSVTAGSKTTPNPFIDVLAKRLKPKTKKRKKKKKRTCQTSEFGCCFDGITWAKGPFNEGCNIVTTCVESKFGCCQDGVSPAMGTNFENCPPSICNETLFGCCSDNFTPAEGNDGEGCPKEKPPPPKCVGSEFGCCPDNVTAAAGKKFKGCAESTPVSTEKPEMKPNVTCSTSNFGCCPDNVTSAQGKSFEGCKEIDHKNCSASFFGCCADGTTAALGVKQEGCPPACKSSKYGCCDDQLTPAHGVNKEGCCLITPHGCCPDNIKPADGPNLEGCGCQYTSYGCCPDNKTIARGPANEGCGCQYTGHGCCPDKYTPALGPNYEGCPCHTYQFGCCPDGVTRAKGPRLQGCGCEHTVFGCCSDERTPATNPERNCSCQATKYGCCLDGVTEAKGEEFAGCPVLPEKKSRACKEPKDKGSCRDFTVKWFFDTEYGGCSKFWYGGCDGNNNRFKTQEECRSVCVEPPGKDACYLPRISGPCEGYYPAWYYDSDRKQCGQFIYGGCLGNNNRFQTREECQQLCGAHSFMDVCEQPIMEGPCEGVYPRWSFDKTSKSCVEFNYGGCQGNDNNFPTQYACHQRCMEPGHSRDECSLPRVQGNCGERIPRWFFDASENRCMPFYYSGCDGNRNNFESLDVCERICPPKVDRDLCTLPAIQGECSNYVERWYFDSYEDSCKPFYYGGCGGSQNNFPTIKDCQARCDSKYVPEVAPSPPPAFKSENCFLPNDYGSCRQVSQVMWYYDHQDGVCKQFLYGGCDGNENKFASRNDCEEKCSSVQDICDLPRVIGPCNGNYRQWYYDRTSDTCLLFDFGGCQGNGNRFEDEGTCVNRCVRVKIKPTQPPPPTPPATAPPQPSIEDICFSPVDPGPCLQQRGAWYFDSTTRRCQVFTYSGCDGNANRFNSEEECDSKCGHFKEPAVPEATQAPVDEPNVNAEEGYYVTLKCTVVLYPAPVITWQKGNVTIQGSIGRIRILVDGALQIIGLYKSDAGIYICTANNNIQPPVRKEFNLIIRDPVERPAQVVGEETVTSVTVTLGQPTVLQCFIVGWPRPAVTWWRGSVMIPFSSELFEQQQDNSLLIRQVSISNLGPYTCQAYNGLGSAASWNIILRAVGRVEKPRETLFSEYLIPPSTSEESKIILTTAGTTTAAPAPETPRVYIVPVTANISLPSQIFTVGSVISIPCKTDGYPIPQVKWYKDNYELENSDRISITDNRLTILKGETSDTGTYRCIAANLYDSATSSVYVSVSGVYVHPLCTDNPFFANCKLIVKARYCSHQYYGKFCCKSCTEAGLLPPQGRPSFSESHQEPNQEQSPQRRRRSLNSSFQILVKELPERYLKT